ncbi:MAG: hypothetical protein A2Y33_11760 [Spirochaetes bacterium GWF1_51_8]|nr:MAG: hypothetical protein A2Y33_11760 [Spirochaetes bacterium GWF1_51_8]
MRFPVIVFNVLITAAIVFSGEHSRTGDITKVKLLMISEISNIILLLDDSIFKIGQSETAGEVADVIDHLGVTAKAGLKYIQRIGWKFEKELSADKAFLEIGKKYSEKLYEKNIEFQNAITEWKEKKDLSSEDSLIIKKALEKFHKFEEAEPITK